MKKPAENIEHFFPHVPLYEVKLADIGYFPIFVSIFDHWLYEDELNACQVTCYDDAIETQKIDEYLAGDEKLFSFYQRLAKGGVYIWEIEYVMIDHSVVKGPNPIEREDYWQAQAGDAGFEKLLTERLRADDLYLRHIDFYFPELEIRSLKAETRTDLLLLRDKAILPALKKIAKEQGVYLLDGDHLDILEEKYLEHSPKSQ